MYLFSLDPPIWQTSVEPVTTTADKVVLTCSACSFDIQMKDTAQYDWEIDGELDPNKEILCSFIILQRCIFTIYVLCSTTCSGNLELLIFSELEHLPI